MIANSERSGAHQLLEMMCSSDLSNLLATVTKNLLVITARQDVISAIVDYSESSLELLKRKKVKRDLLFKYLARQSVVVNASVDKAGLIQTVLKYWGAAPARLQEFEDMEIEEECEVSQPAYTTSHEHIHSTPPPTKETHPELLEMASVFARWFYQMLNSYHPFAREAPTESFGEQHFFSDCTLKVMQYMPYNCVEAYHGATEVVEKLLSLVKDSNLVLNPNIDEGGLKGLSNPHGLRVLYVCGTVHGGAGNMVGLYQQQFGLIRDPSMDNNWKIKFTNLLLSSEQRQTSPVFGCEDPFLALQV